MREEKTRNNNRAGTVESPPRIGPPAVAQSAAAGETSPVRCDPDGESLSASRRIQVLTRAVNILHTVSNADGDLSLGKIALELDLPRSTVQRIVNALLAENLLAVGPNASGYRIGVAVQQLADSTTQGVPQSLRPVLEGLSEATGETIDLATCRDQQMVFLDQIPGKHRLRTVSAVGEIFPMTVTANGKAVLAMQENDTVSQIHLRETKDAVTAKTLAALQSELQQVRTDGYSVDLDEHTTGISAIGIGFRYRSICYAISIPAPTHRFSERRQEFIDCIMDSRSQIKQALPQIEFD